MPQPNYPPPNNEHITEPRRLNRWLDLNPQGGALTRIQKYITLPAFEATDAWNQYSQIVTTFNFEASNNFSLKSIDVPINPNFALFISYRIGEEVTRYLLWNAEGSRFGFELIPYVNQLILKNFRLEIWDTSQGAANNLTAINLYTSVRGNTDYMWDNDSSLKDSDGQNTLFWNVAETIPNPSDYGLILTRMLATYGVITDTSWTSTDNVDILLGGALSATDIVARYNTLIAITAGAAISGTAQGDVNNLFVAFQYKALTGADRVNNLVTFNNSYSVSHGIDTGNNYIDVNGTILINSNELIDGDIYLLVCVAGIQAFLFNVHTGQATNLTNIAVGIGTSTTLDIADAECPDKILEVLPMYNVTDYQAVYRYFFYTYNGPFLLPLTLPNNSISVTN